MKLAQLVALPKCEFDLRCAVTALLNGQVVQLEDGTQMVLAADKRQVIIRKPPAPITATDVMEAFKAALDAER